MRLFLPVIYVKKVIGRPSKENKAPYAVMPLETSHKITSQSYCNVHPYEAHRSTTTWISDF